MEATKQSPGHSIWKYPTINGYGVLTAESRVREK